MYIQFTKRTICPHMILIVHIFASIIPNRHVFMVYVCFYFRPWPKRKQSPVSQYGIFYINRLLPMLCSLTMPVKPFLIILAGFKTFRRRTFQAMLCPERILHLFNLFYVIWDNHRQGFYSLLLPTLWSGHSFQRPALDG